MRRTLTIKAFMLLTLTLPFFSFSQNMALETQIKAAFLYKFSQYVTWPPAQFATPETPIILAISGADNLATELKRIANDHKINGRSIVVRQLTEEDSLEGVDIWFAGAGLSDIPQTAIDLPILIVTDTVNSVDAGTINFVVENNKVRFDIFQNKAEQAGLKLSSQLLSVARHVERGNE